IGIENDFFSMGGHSLSALKLINRVQKEFNVKIPFREIYQSPTIAALALKIQNSDITEHIGIPNQPQQEYYPLSYTQKRLWLLHQLTPGDTAFIMGGKLTLNEKVEEYIIKETFAILGDRHESLRTCFIEVEDQPVQQILPHVEPEISQIDITHLEEKELELKRAELDRLENTTPFQLDKAPLYRIKLIKITEETFDILITMHHIITDGWSMEILQQEFFTIYEYIKQGKETQLMPMRIQYKDYAAWQNSILEDPQKMEAARKFWKQRLTGDTEGELTPLQLPYDFIKGKKGGKKGAGKKDGPAKTSAGYRTAIPMEVAAKLKKLARQFDAGLFTVLLAGFYLFLSRATGQKNILLAIPAAGRRHDDLKNIIGYFVNTLILKKRVNPEDNFNDFLTAIRQDTMQVLDYQDYPLELICSELKIKYPDISVFFNMTTLGDSNRQTKDDFETYPLEYVPNVKFDMVFYVAEYENAVGIDIHYSTALFTPGKIEKLMNMYRKILEDIAAKPGKKIKDYLSAKKKLKIKLGK
ncbi:MAG: hypothetical protein GY757_55910, partial [bacterium]|nr:hypothetical protein [bacterium]